MPLASPTATFAWILVWSRESRKAMACPTWGVHRTGKPSPRSAPEQRSWTGESIGDYSYMTATEDLEAVRTLVALAQVAVIRVRAGHPAPRTVLAGARSRLRGVLEGPDWSYIPPVGAVWRDAWSRERQGWRERAAFLNGAEVFGVDYEVCRGCRLGWVEQPSTPYEEHRRQGLARAALEALRTEHPGLEWHTLGGHIPDSVPFWKTVSEGVPGGYTRRAMCRHKRPGG